MGGHYGTATDAETYHSARSSADWEPVPPHCATLGPRLPSLTARRGGVSREALAGQRVAVGIAEVEVTDEAVWHEIVEVRPLAPAGVAVLVDLDLGTYQPQLARISVSLAALVDYERRSRQMVDKLTNKQAQAFNALDADGRGKWLADNKKDKEQKAAPASGGSSSRGKRRQCFRALRAASLDLPTPF
jgi:hypothetical protein